MSAKLLSEFDTYHQRPQPQQQQLPASSIGEITGSVYDDLACLDNNGSQPSNNSTWKLSNGSLSWAKEKGENEKLQSSNTGKAKDAVLSAMTVPPREGSKSVALSNQNRETKSEGQSEVLFDAFEEMGKADDEDEFGDFESGVHVPQPYISRRPLTSISDAGFGQGYTEQGLEGPRTDLNALSYVKTPALLGLQEHDSPDGSLISIESITATAGRNTASPSMIASHSHLSQATQSSTWNVTDGPLSDDGWGDFEGATDTAISPREISKDIPSNSILKPTALGTDDPRASKSRTDNHTQRSPTNRAGCPSLTLGPRSSLNANPSHSLQQSAAPSNIPPPSILLPLLTNILQDYHNTITSCRDSATCGPAETNPILNLLQLVTVTAHIIAGRKLRWKRDMLLAQNMKIGPSHSGKAGGMKLTGIDKAESLREDREVIDLLRVWKDHIGRVRSAIRLTTSISTSIPTLSEIMPVKAGKGGLTSAKGCALCGLKREERVDKVDELVEDSFGEWWVEHWGHTTCEWFWDRYHEKLRQR